MFFILGYLPEGVLNLVQGGEETGKALAGHPRVDGFAFTGSNAVGMSILRHAASPTAMRPVLCEMGGKNPAIVAESADLAVAASGVARSAFGLSGQKCSAASKAYVARAVLDDTTIEVDVWVYDPPALAEPWYTRQSYAKLADPDRSLRIRYWHCGENQNNAVVETPTGGTEFDDFTFTDKDDRGGETK